jgi:hypothetical protein
MLCLPHSPLVLTTPRPPQQPPAPSAILCTRTGSKSRNDPVAPTARLTLPLLCLSACLVRCRHLGVVGRCLAGVVVLACLLHVRVSRDAGLRTVGCVAVLDAKRRVSWSSRVSHREELGGGRCAYGEAHDAEGWSSGDMMRCNRLRCDAMGEMSTAEAQRKCWMAGKRGCCSMSLMMSVQ